ncbi:hypothetical protein B425_4055 [Bacillus amyloliquefaciens]|nr:hypothetical protein B425_4055 [Bacillus amyloliquefaciens]
MFSSFFPSWYRFIYVFPGIRNGETHIHSLTNTGKAIFFYSFS